LADRFAYSENNAHSFCLAAFEDAVDFRDVGLVVYDPSVNFNPCVRLERKHLSSDDHFRTPSETPKEDGSGCGSLQTQDRFRIESASKIDCMADCLHIWRPATCPRSDGLTSDTGVYLLKRAKSHHEADLGKLRVASKHK
ncbi:MAG: hypothetical protein P4L70_10695, partial [Parasulfuritortus sp.]|nr:hypothetical protein [Parasulfuritortus sp.]